MENQAPSPHPATPDELAAQAVIRQAAATLRQAAIVLQGVRSSLPEPAAAEEMGERKLPETLSFAIVGLVECVLADDLLPAIQSLEEGAGMTPESLFSEWAARKKDEEHQ